MSSPRRVVIAIVLQRECHSGPRPIFAPPIFQRIKGFVHQLQDLAARYFQNLRLPSEVGRQSFASRLGGLSKLPERVLGTEIEGVALSGVDFLLASFNH